MDKPPQEIKVLHEFPPLYNPSNLPMRRVLRARILSRHGKTPVLDIRWWDAGEGFTKNGVSIPLEARALLRLESIPMGALAYAKHNNLITEDEEGGGFDWEEYIHPDITRGKSDG